MDLRTKHRLIGGMVVVAAIAIFIPILFHRDTMKDPDLNLSAKIPVAPTAAKYQSASNNIVFNFSSESQDQPTAKPKIAALTNAKPSDKKIQTKVSAKSKVAKPVLALEKPPQAWVVQLGTFANKANVDALIKKLRTSGFDAYARTKISNNKTLQQVMVGPEIKKSKADNLRGQLQAKYQLKGVVTQYKVS